MSIKYNVGTIIKYYRQGMSTNKIAELFNCSASSVRYLLKQHGEPLRTHSDAQKRALENNPEIHPTRGKEHKESSKNKTSESMKKYQEKQRIERNKKKREERRNAKNKETNN